MLPLLNPVWVVNMYLVSTSTTDTTENNILLGFAGAFLGKNIYENAEVQYV